MNIQPRPQEIQRREIQRRGQGDPGAQQSKPRIEEQPARAEQQQEAQVPPAVAPAAQVRRAATGRPETSVVGTSAIRRPCERRLDHHLGRELHAGASAGRAPRTRFRSKAAQAAVEVADAGARKNRRPMKREHRVAELAVQRAASRRARCRRWKRLPMTRSSPSRSFSTNGVEVAEVVAVVGVAHDDVPAARRLDAAHERRAVAALGDRRPRARPAPAAESPASRRCCRCRPITISPRCRRARGSRVALRDAARERLRLVEARHQNREPVLSVPLQRRSGERPQKKGTPRGYLFWSFSL